MDSPLVIVYGSPMTTCNQLQSGGSIAIVGAGPAGATLARLLQTRGFGVAVYERDASATARPQGGSLDVRRSTGQKAVDAAGLTEVFRQHSRDEAKDFKMMGADGHEIPMGGQETHEDAGPEIDRGDLRQLLLDSLDAGTVRWDCRVADVHPEPDGRWRLEFDGGNKPVTADLVVGADGVGSRVRHRLTSAEPHYTGHTMLAANIRKDLWRGSDLDGLLGEGSVMFAGGHKTIFVQRCNHDVILLYYSLQVPKEWPESEPFDLQNVDAVLDCIRSAYADWSPEVVEMLTRIEPKFHKWPLSFMPPEDSWETRPGLTMIGDSSHAMPPFTGKGVNLAMFDALSLADGLRADPSASVASVLETFEQAMQARTRAELGACLEIGRSHYGIEMNFDQK